MGNIKQGIPVYGKEKGVDMNHDSINQEKLATAIRAKEFIHDEVSSVISYVMSGRPSKHHRNTVSFGTRNPDEQLVSALRL